MKKAENKKEYELIEETAKIYRTITRDAMDGFLIVDMNGRFLDVNDSYCNLIGYSRGELLKMNISDVEDNNSIKIAKNIKIVKTVGKYNYSTKHRKKDGKMVDIEASANYANYLGGLILIFLCDITKHKKAERDLAKNRAKSRNIVEKQLTESYAHLGLINRKISLLLELGKYTKSKGDRQEVIDHILNLAMNISNAPTGYLYGSKTRGKFSLLSSRGVKDNQKEKINVITARTVGLLKHLVREKNLISGNIKRYEAELLALDNKLEYFVTLPLSKGVALGGFIFLGFNKRENVDAQDLEFLDVFATHASSALVKVGVFK
jgi:PAS domain S-box-containing protein